MRQMVFGYLTAIINWILLLQTGGSLVRKREPARMNGISEWNGGKLYLVGEKLNGNSEELVIG